MPLEHYAAQRPGRHAAADLLSFFGAGRSQTVGRCRYGFTVDHCIHGDSCKATSRGDVCNFGKRIRTEVLVTGAQHSALCYCRFRDRRVACHQR